MPKVIIPNSGVKASRLLTLSAERNAGELAVNTTISIESRISGPNSGLD
jgi:hypothetical protein